MRLGREPGCWRTDRALEPGAHSNQADPRFASSRDGDSHLLPGSVCTDAAIDAGVAFVIDGALPPSGAALDIGPTAEDTPRSLQALGAEALLTGDLWGFPDPEGLLLIRSAHHHSAPDSPDPPLLAVLHYSARPTGTERSGRSTDG